MQSKEKLTLMLLASLLGAIGIIIPMIAPKLVLEPASFTLASHVPVFIAMFISPFTAVSVSLITCIGFLVAGFPIVVVLRALSHLIFAYLGALFLKKNARLFADSSRIVVFALAISLLHAVSEVAVSMYFYFGQHLIGAYYQKGFLTSIIGLVGIGTFIHSLIDFSIAYYLWKPLKQVTKVPTSLNIPH